MTLDEQDWPAMATNLAHALGVVGDRWALQIVAELLDGPRRFGELAESLQGIAPNILTSRLRQLERNGLVAVAPYSHRPVRLAYSLTDTARELGDAIALLAAWGGRQNGDTGGRVHAACGTPLEARLYCPTCERPADESDGDPISWV